MKTLDAMDFDGLVDDDFIYESDVNRGFSVLRITANIHKPHVPKVYFEETYIPKLGEAENHE